MADIVERLRAAAKLPKKKIMVAAALNEAADEIEILREELKRLRATLPDSTSLPR